MSYLDNPNTKRMATRCILCSTPLGCPKSVELGIGPHCRKKPGYRDDFKAIDADTKKKAGKLIHVAGCAYEDNDIETVLGVSTELETMGLPNLSYIIRKRFVEVVIERENDVPVYKWQKGQGETLTDQKRNVVKVTTPYNQSFNQKRRKYVGGQHRPVKVGKDFHWEFDASQALQVLHLLSVCFPGKKALGDNGIFVIPTEAEFRAKYLNHSKRACR